MDQDQIDAERSTSLRSNGEELITNDDVGREDEEMPQLDDMPDFEDHDNSNLSQPQDQSVSKSKSSSTRSQSLSPPLDDSISRSRSELDPDATVDPEISLPSIDRIEEDDEDGETSLDRLKKRRDALKEKEDNKADVGSELEDGYETESEEESDQEDDDQVANKSSKVKGKDGRGAAILKKRISRKKKR